MKTRSSWLKNLILAGILSTPSIVTGETLLRTIQCKEKYWNVFVKALDQYCKDVIDGDDMEACIAVKKSFATCKGINVRSVNVEFYNDDGVYGISYLGPYEVIFKTPQNKWIVTEIRPVCDR